MYQEIQLPLSLVSLSFSLASLTNQFRVKAVQARLKTESVFQSPFTSIECLHRSDASVCLGLYKRACMTQTQGLPQSLSATIVGSYLRFLSDLISGVISKNRKRDPLLQCEGA